VKLQQEWWVCQTRNGKNQPPLKRALADANKIRKVEFFEEIYNNLLKNIALFCRTVE
jgi:hypothetical protein